MEFPRFTLVLILTLSCALKWTHISAFNLDAENAVRKSGDPGSFFGFSLAMHRQLHPTDKRILLVGAPRAKAFAKQKANVTGGLYNCDINTKSSSCTRVQFDDNVNLEEESKENQWMGVTVQSQGPGGKIVTCAHRYQRRQFVNTDQETRNIIGRCYVLSEDLTINTASEEDGGNWNFCEGRTGGHERFGSCQQGVSATFTKDYHYVLFGAPGGYDWKGIVRVEQKNETLLDLGIYDDGPYEVGDENRLDPLLVPVPPCSYLGFSLDSGKSLTKKGQLTVVAGAPRANHSGAVVLLKIDGTAMLSAEFTLEGPGLASSFGYDVAVADLNGDGWQDIVVGAPQFFLKDSSVGGAVYVYINKAGLWNSVKPVRLEGTKDSMFGQVVENLGDINLDSFEDFAVGAPYDEDGSGSVYIYHGAAREVNTKPSQILQGKDSNVKFFGYSLAGNMDVDRNSYPDLAVGSLSDAVFVYRSRPVITIEKTVTTTPKVLDFTKKNCGDSICMDVEACFTFTANPKTYNPKLTVAYNFTAESMRRKQGLPPRVTFTKKSPTDSDYESTGTLEITGQGQKKCVKVQAKLQDNIRDKLRGIPIDVSVEIQNPKRRKRQDVVPQPAPMLDPNQDNGVSTNVNFLKEGCGSNNVCQSKLQLQYQFCSQDPSKDSFPPLPVEDGMPVVTLSDQKDIALEITVSNLNGDDAHEAHLVANFPNGLFYSTYRPLNSMVTCKANQNGSQADCELGNPFKRDAEVTFYMILSTSTFSSNTIDIDLRLETTSEQKDKVKVTASAKVVIELQLSVSGLAKPSQLYFSGVVKGESAMKSEADIGPQIEYEFRIINLGKRLDSSATASLTINWPKVTDQGKWILYLMKIHTEGLEGNSCSSMNEVNPNNLKEERLPSRNKRAVDKSDEGKISLFKDKRESKLLSCEDGAKCATLRCPLQGLDSSAVIVLKFRLWNSTFLEDYSKLNYIDILTKASLNLDNTADNTVLKDAETQVRITVFPERKAQQYAGMPWWIILVAILLGLLLLALLVLLLWKCNFFRSQKDPKPADKERLTTDA